MSCPQLVIRIGLGLLARVVRREDVAGLVVGVENQGAGSGLAPRALVLIGVFCQNTQYRPLCPVVLIRVFCQNTRNRPLCSHVPLLFSH